MHILLIHQAFAALDEPGGTRHHEIARYLAEQGHQVTVIASPISYLAGSQQKAPAWRTEAVDDLGVRIIRAYTYQMQHKDTLRRMYAHLSFMLSSFLIGLSIKNVDIVWSTSPPFFQSGGSWLLARLKGARLLFEVRDLYPAFALAFGVVTNPLIIALAETYEKFLYRSADQLMVNSPGYIQHLKARGGKDIALIPNGADTSMFNPQEEGAAFRARHGLQDKFIALYAGAHGQANDLAVIVDSAKYLANNKIIAIALVGDGKEKDALIARAAELSLTNIHFIPPIPKNGMAEALAAADACIAHLKPLELFKTVYPNKVFDYMAAGRPLVMAIDGVSRDVVEKAGAGVIAPPGDARAIAAAIQYLADHPDEAKRMGRAGRAYLENHFDRARLAADFEKLMIQLANR
jgi:glycosyltransferase involved in cell wall biosynthesis